MLTQRIADGVRDLGVGAPDQRLRAPHIVSLGMAGGVPKHLIARLAAENVHVALRLGRMRVSPHVFNDEADTDRFIAVLARALDG